MVITMIMSVTLVITRNCGQIYRKWEKIPN